MCHPRGGCIHVGRLSSPSRLTPALSPQVLHKQGLVSYDKLRQLSWAPHPSLTMLLAHAFHASDPRAALQPEVGVGVNSGP